MNVESIVRQFSTKSALVVGDICLDRWSTYEPAASQPSRETGIPRIGVVSTECTPGAAGTVASNLAALGAGCVSVLGVVGEDGHGFELLQSLSQRKITAELLYRTPLVTTFTYTKLLNANTGIEDLPRLDFIHNTPMPDEVDAEVVRRLEAFFDAFDIILVSDQAETENGGVVTPLMRDKLAQLAKSNPDRTIWVDSRVRAELFRHMVLKPNQIEAQEASMRALGRVDFEALRQHTASPFLLVTRGGQGTLVVAPGKIIHAPAYPTEVVDICGAGDSFSAGAALAYAVTGDSLKAAQIGNLVASVTVTKKGTGVASADEVLRAARNLL